MRKKIVILGGASLIGHQIYYHLKSICKYDIFIFTNQSRLQDHSIKINAREEDKLLGKISEISPDIIINCIGILIEGSSKDPENAIFINSYLPHRLAGYATSQNAKFIQISTDCVFSGNKEDPYSEDDSPDGLSNYARSKSLGEVTYGNHLTLRTSVVGPELKQSGGGLLNWFLHQSGVITGYTKSIWSGVTTIELARAVERSIKLNLSGLHHVTNNSSLSKYELLLFFKQISGKEIKIIPADGVVSNKSFIDSKGFISKDIPSYEAMFHEMFNLIKDKRSLYPHYF